MKPRLPIGAHVPVHPQSIVEGARWVRITNSKSRFGIRPTQISRLSGLTLLLAMIIGATLDASTVVFLISTDRIIVAADSRQRLIRSDGLGPPTIHDSSCKIRVGNHAVFVATGVTSDSSGFDVRRTALDLLNRSQTVKERYTEFVRRIQANIRFGSQGHYERNVTVTFAQWDDGGPSMVTAEFAPTQLLSVWMFQEKALNACSGLKNCNSFRALGASEAIDDDALDALLTKRPNERAMAALAISAVERQAHATPDEVGGPIDVAVIDKKGIRWVQRKPECQ